MARRCGGNKTPHSSSRSSNDSREGGCRSRGNTPCNFRACRAPSRRLSDSKQGNVELTQKSSCLDALLRENILLTILPFLEAADATRFGSCCSELQAALRAPRIQPLWRRWFEKSGFVWWPYGGVCGAACLLQVDNDGFVLQHQQQEQQCQIAGGERVHPPAGYKQFRHEGWCCQFLWNARAWDKWKRGCCAFASLPTDSHKLFMVSVHPKGVYSSRAEASGIPPTVSGQQQAGTLSQNAATCGLQPEQPQQQVCSQAESSDALNAATFSKQTEESLPQPAVHFTPGAGRSLLNALHDKVAVLTAASDRVLCFIDPLAGPSPAGSRTPRPALPACRTQTSPGATGGVLKPPKDPCTSLSPRTTYTSLGNFSSLETLELELESLISGGSCRRGSGKGRRSGGPRHAGGGAFGEMRKTNCSGVSGTNGVSKGGSSSRAAATPSSSLLGSPLVAAAPPTEFPNTQTAAALEVKEICRCAPRISWLGCSVDAASGLMACCMASNEQGSNGRRRRKKGGSGGGMADACEYRVFDLLTESVSGLSSLELCR